MGLHVEEEEDDDSPPASPSMSPPASPPEYHSAELVVEPLPIPDEDSKEELRGTPKAFSFGVDFLLGKSNQDKTDVKKSLCG